MSAELEVLESLRSFFAQRFPAAVERGFGDDEPILESGVVDSMGIIEIATFLEEEFSLVLSDDDVTSENFASMAALARLVKARTSAGVALSDVPVQS